MASWLTIEEALRSAFNYRNRGIRQNTLPILFSDGNFDDLQIYEVWPGESWDDPRGWTCKVRPATEEERRTLKYIAEKYPLGHQCFSGRYSIRGYVRRFKHHNFDVFAGAEIGTEQHLVFKWDFTLDLDEVERLRAIERGRELPSDEYLEKMRGLED